MQCLGNFCVPKFEGLGIEPGAMNDKKDNMLVIFKNNRAVKVELYQAPLIEETPEGESTATIEN